MSNTTFGVMLDFSRNGVMKISELKNYCNILKKFGYNSIYLYIEDTYELDGEPYFGHLRGRYSKQELKEINDYCNSIGITVIPCFQTLAHLNQMFKWEVYNDIRDTGDIMLCEEEKTYALIEKMFQTFKECLSTNVVHIGMDEAHNLGLGKYLDKHGFKNRFEILTKHLKRVLEIAEKYGYRSIMWSDMFFRLAYEGVYRPANPDLTKLDFVKPLIPNNVTLCYWDYYSPDVKDYESCIKMHRYVSNNICFAGGLWRWKGFAPQNELSIKHTKSAMRACKKHGINEVFFTSWGDDGSECSFYGILPSLLCAVEFYNGNENMASIKAKFKELTGADYDAFMKLDKLNNRKHYFDNEEKYSLYNDCFVGLFDYSLDGADEYYKKLAKTLNSASKKVGEYAYILKTGKALADVLSLKAELGIKTRKAYLEKDSEALKNIANVVYHKLIKNLDKFIELFEYQWNKENKPFGLEIQQHRLGGLKQRLISCRKVLNDYLNGKITNIAELEEPVLPFKKEDKKIDVTPHSVIISANVTGHYQ